jgi:hypothetical protein
VAKLFNQYRFEGTFEQRTRSVVPLIESFTVSIKYRLNRSSYALITILPQQEMVMIWHQAESYNTHLRTYKIFSKPS